MTDAPFWKTKTLDQMNPEEWESLCDGCAKCCLVKLEDEDTGALAYTTLHCWFLDGKTCQCSDYANRRKYVPGCVQLTPAVVATVDWLPDSCAYRLVLAGKDLPDWHHLILVDEDDQEDWIIDWDGTPP
jgi:uncharacterized protein